MQTVCCTTSQDTTMRKDTSVLQLSKVELTLPPPPASLHLITIPFSWIYTKQVKKRAKTELPGSQSVQLHPEMAPGSGAGSRLTPVGKSYSWLGAQRPPQYTPDLGIFHPGQSEHHCSYRNGRSCLLHLSSEDAKTQTHPNTKNPCHIPTTDTTCAPSKHVIFCMHINQQNYK